MWTFCGPASVRITSERETYQVIGGTCENGQPGLEDWYFVSVGTSTLTDGAPPKARSFELAVNAQHAGAYSVADADVSWSLPEKRYDEWETLDVEVISGLASGSFSGVLDSGEAVTGSWHC